MEKSKKQISVGPFVLASILTSYPDADFQSALLELLDDESISIPKTLVQSLERIIENPVGVDDLRSEYIAIFDHSKSLNPLYETEYGRERAMFKAHELMDIAGFYRAFGFDLHEAGDREMVDHISVELEFYSLLLMKLQYLQELGDQEGCEVVLEGMRKFMDSHLGRFVGAILERDGVRSSEIYRQIFEWTDMIVSQECERLGVRPETATWLSSQRESEEVCCGGSVAINK